MEPVAEWIRENPVPTIVGFLASILGIASFFGLTWSRVVEFFVLVMDVRFAREPTFAPPYWLTGWPRGIRFTADQMWKMSNEWPDKRVPAVAWQLRLLFYRAVALIWPFTQATLDCPEWQEPFPYNMKFTADQVRRFHGQRPAPPTGLRIGFDDCDCPSCCDMGMLRT